MPPPERIDTVELNRRIGLLGLAEKQTSLTRKTPKEFGGPCPFCGGVDRFSVQTEKNAWLCRHCTEGKWSDPIDFAMRLHNSNFRDIAVMYLGSDAPRIDPGIAAERERRYATEQANRQAQKAARLKEYTSAELWAELHQRMAESERQQWRTWGIPDSWQDYLELGYTPDKPFSDGSTLQHSPAYTIPYFHNATNGKQFATMQYRLVNAPNPTDRYRFEYNLGTTYYETTPTECMGEIAIICEGAKKAAVVKIHGGVDKRTSVLGVPSKSDSAGVAEAVKDCGWVYVMLDPDGGREARKLARTIGDKAKVVELPGKSDDLILNGHITKNELRQAFRWAVKA